MTQSLEFLHKRHLRARSSLMMTGSALLLSSLLLIIFLSLMMRSEWIDDGIVQAKMVAATSNAALLFGDERAANEILSALEVSPSVNYAGLTMPDGKLLAYHQRSGAQMPQALEAKPLKPGQAFGLKALVVIEPVRDGGKSIGFVTMQFSLQPFYQRLLGYIVVIMAVALGALLIVQLFLSRMRGAVNRAEQHLEFLAHSDPVTALPNRRAFNTALDEAILLAQEQQSYLGLILLDLDNFKVVNDTMGHTCGDEILRMVAHRIRSCMRDADLVFRLGGDEFVAIIDFDANPSEDLYVVAHRLLAVLAQPFNFEEHEFFLTASIGSSLFPADAEDGQNLIRKADTAMYSAKVMGKNTFAPFVAEMDSVAQRRLQIDNNLRRALERNELAAHYQPQVNIADGRIDGVELLLRWSHPELGFVSPAEFIPVAEESGLIVEIGKWVLQEACEQMAAWRAEGIAPDRVAVNLSIRQVRDSALMGEILRLLQENGLTAEQLELEITEGLLMENVQENIIFLEQLQQAGIKLSVDDFGTGYSSLSYLKRFPVNQLKIDRSFMHDIPGEGEAFITAIIAMAHKLGLSVVAEGVETREQLEFLRESGCDTFQGFYFARPMPAVQLGDLLRNNR